MISFQRLLVLNAGPAFLLILLLCTFAPAQDRPFVVGQIEFYGYSGLDVNAVKAALPIHESDVIAPAELPRLKDKINQSLRDKLGVSATGISLVCCGADGNWMIFVGLPGASFQSFPYLTVPAGKVQLTKRIVNLYEHAIALNLEAVQKQPAEDRSKGYALSAYPPLREVQLRIRDFAIRQESLIRRALKNSAAADSRRAAAYALGYAQASQRQVSDLITASRDSDDTVRNNAVRALGVIAASNDRRAAAIPAGPFVQMLKSGIWEDRNKALMVLGILTRRRQPELLRELKRQSLEALVEMARWRDAGHASDARVILGRIAAIEESQLQKLAIDNPEEIIRMVKAARDE
ncbi:MAG: hypothetical protein ACXW18_02550 [Pyrinomonadaceae bacterium]